MKLHREKMYILEWRTVSLLTRRLFWCLFLELRSRERTWYQNNTQVSAETVSHETKYIILFLTWYNVSINDDKHRRYLHNVPVYHSLVFRSADDFNRLLMASLWPDNCHAITWIVISKSLDIDYVHGDIQGRLCKNYPFPNGATVEVWKWVSNFISHFIMHVITCICPW